MVSEDLASSTVVPAFVVERATEPPVHSSQKRPTVSIIVAVRNMEETIGRCVESLLNVDYPNKEILVVDDGSTDTTPEVLRRYPVSVVRIPNSGVSAARNTGLTRCRSEIVAFTDGDCYVERDWLSGLVQRFDRPSVAGVGGFVDFERKGIIATALSIEYEKRFLRRETETWSIACINAAFRRDVLEAVGGFRKLAGEMVGGEDIDLSYRIVEQGFELVYTPSAVVHHGAKEMSRGLAKRNFRNALVSVTIFHDHRIAKEDPFFGASLKAQPFVLAACAFGCLAGFLIGWYYWWILALPVFIWNVPLGIETWRYLRKPMAVVAVPAVLAVRSSAILLGALWGMRWLAARKVRQAPARERRHS